MKQASSFQTDYQSNTQTMNQLLRIDESFDVIGREILIGRRKATLYFIDGFAKDDIMEKIMEYFMKIDEKKESEIHSAADFSALMVPYVESDLITSFAEAVTAV